MVNDKSGLNRSVCSAGTNGSSEMSRFLLDRTRNSQLNSNILASGSSSAQFNGFNHHSVQQVRFEI